MLFACLVLLVAGCRGEPSAGRVVGAFFAGLGLNRLVPNEGPSMERMEFFGTAVFVPVFLVSIGLLLDPSVMFTGKALGLAAVICLAAMPPRERAAHRLGAKLLIVTPSAGPSDEAVRAATLLARPDGGSSDLLITRPPTEIGDVPDAVDRALLAHEHSLLIVDEPTFDHAPSSVLAASRRHARGRRRAPTTEEPRTKEPVG